MSAKCESRKVNRLSKLGKYILTKAGAGIDRADLVCGFYGFGRRYCGFYTDPCMNKTEQAAFNQKFRSAQASTSKALARLEKAGLVELVRPDGKNVKRVRLTEAGKEVIQKLNAG